MKPATSHPCVFKGSFVREQIDPRVKERWEKRFDSRTPFGNLRLSFRQAHCAELNPYDSRYCPYSERDCAISFYQCVVTTCLKSRSAKSAVSYFRAVAKTAALDRADNKPIGRNVVEAINDSTQAAQGPGHYRIAERSNPSGSAAVLQADGEVRPVRGRFSVPDRINILLDQFDPRSREGRTPDGETGSE